MEMVFSKGALDTMINEQLPRQALRKVQEENDVPNEGSCRTALEYTRREVLLTRRDGFYYNSQEKSVGEGFTKVCYAAEDAI